MARLCARPGCSAPAAATFNFDGLNRIVWLEPLAEARAHSAGDLCWRHADRLRPPRNWELRDHRRAAPVQPAASAPSRHLAPAHDAPDPAPAPAVAASTQSMAGSGVPAPVEAGGSTPMLARAFRGVGGG